jgi:TRAP-type C4-dicarboxylate transport system substrate-binding protein
MKMKRNRFRVTCLILLFACTAALNAARAAAPVKIRLATLAPKGSSYAKHLQAMGEAWRTAPGGGAQLTVYPDGTMGSEPDMVRRMRLGQLQAAMVTTSGLIEIEPGSAGLQSMPKVYRNLEEVDFIGEKLHPMLEQRLAEKGFVVLFWSDTGFVRFFSKQPVVSPDDMRKTKLFVAANRPQETDIYRSVGCNPVPLEVADILPSLQTGLIDCVCMPPSIALALQLDSIAPNMLDMNWVPLAGALIITKKAWDAIPAETQEAMRKSAAEAGKLIKADGRRENAESIEAMKKRGLKVHALTPQVDAEWDEAVAKSYPKVRGIAVPPDVYDEVMAQLAAFRSGKSK